MVLCDHLDGWDGNGGKEVQVGIYVYIQLIYIVTQQKLTQHCKAIILKKKKKVVFIALPGKKDTVG